MEWIFGELRKLADLKAISEASKQLAKKSTRRLGKRFWRANADLKFF